MTIEAMLRDETKGRHRRSIRLRDYDYAQAGAYYVAICTLHRACLFGEISEEGMRLNEIGQIVQGCWLEIPAHFPRVTPDEFVVMPNHFHGVVVIDVGARHAVPLRESFGKPIPGSLPTIIGSFKAATTKQINQLRDTPRETVWQRNYYEHVIRDDADLNRIRKYITENPAHWSEDPENPKIASVGARHAVPLRYG